MHSTGEHVHILRNAVDKRARAYSQMTSLKQLFTVERCQASALLNVREMWDQWDNFDISAFGKLADKFKVR